MTAILTYKYRLKPTKAQRGQLTETLEQCRWVYNETLATRKTAYEEHGQSMHLHDTQKLLPGWKQDRPALKQVHAQVLQEVQVRVDRAFRAFFRRVKAGDRPGYPRFKGRGWYDSFTYPQYGNGVKLAGNRVYLSKIGWVRFKQHRPLKGTIKTVTLRRDRCGNWYVCFTCEVGPEPLPESSEVVGIDLGLTVFAMLSTGEAIQRQRWMERDAKDIARLQRKKERCPKGSPEWYKVIKALNHAYRRATNRRNNFAHQESRKLVNRFGKIVFENLDIQGMQANGHRNINRGIADVAWGRFVQYTVYKAERAGRGGVRVNPRGTTQQVLRLWCYCSERPVGSRA
jgi:putative transposase